MERAGKSFGLLLEDELCCGSTAKRIGNSRLFEWLRQENEKRLLETGAKRIVTACAGCFKTLKQDYPGLSEKVQLLHSTEYLLSLLKDGRLRFKRAPIKVTYHDPCHLGRHADVFEEPREILAAVPGLKLIEMRDSREMSRCCGGGAGVKTAYPEVSRKAALRRLKDAERTGADMLVTACPFCVQTLREAAGDSGSKIEILELAVLLDRLAEPGGAGSR
jgi:Fe-S oxidoreductase